MQTGLAKDGLSPTTIHRCSRSKDNKRSVRIVAWRLSSRRFRTAQPTWNQAKFDMISAACPVRSAPATSVRERRAATISGRTARLLLKLIVAADFSRSALRRTISTSLLLTFLAAFGVVGYGLAVWLSQRF